MGLGDGFQRVVLVGNSEVGSRDRWEEGEDSKIAVFDGREQFLVGGELLVGVIAVEEVVLAVLQSHQPVEAQLPLAFALSAPRLAHSK